MYAAQYTHPEVTQVYFVECRECCWQSESYADPNDFTAETCDDCGWV
jgi:hypothetical protein